jgi:GNAT superfamily N-acetyltransferase
VRHIPACYLKAALDDPAASVMAQHGSSGDVAALASLIRAASRDSAELGVLVEDAWQRRGIGRRVVTRLIAAAPARGITVVEASVLAENAKVADLLQQVPGDFPLTIDGPAVKYGYCCAAPGTRPRTGKARRCSHHSAPALIACLRLCR